MTHTAGRHEKSIPEAMFFRGSLDDWSPFSGQDLQFRDSDFGDVERSLSTLLMSTQAQNETPAQRRERLHAEFFA